MAKKKSSTTAKIKELTGVRSEKITDEDLIRLQTAISNMNQSYVELGRLSAAQHNQLHALAGMQDQLGVLREEMKKSYGSDDINIQDGNINYPENGQTN